MWGPELGAMPSDLSKGRADCSVPCGGTAGHGLIVLVTMITQLPHLSRVEQRDLFSWV